MTDCEGSEGYVEESHPVVFVGGWTGAGEWGKCCGSFTFAKNFVIRPSSVTEKNTYDHTDELENAEETLARPSPMETNF